MYIIKRGVCLKGEAREGGWCDFTEQLDSFPMLHFLSFRVSFFQSFAIDDDGADGVAAAVTATDICAVAASQPVSSSLIVPPPSWLSISIPFSPETKVKTSFFLLGQPSFSVDFHFVRTRNYIAKSVNPSALLFSSKL